MSGADGFVSDLAFQSLWPEASNASNEVVDYFCLPNARQPRLLVPRGSAARTTLHALRDASTATARTKTKLLSLAIQLGGVNLERQQLPTPPVVAHLSQLLGYDELIAAVHLGPPRANRKPVLALATAGGEVIGFAKLAVNELTSSLVTNEADALTNLSSTVGFEVPQLSLMTEWNGFPLTVQTPVADVGRSSLDADAVISAQVLISQTGRDDRSLRAYLASLINRLNDVSIDRQQVVNTVDRVRSVVDELAVRPDVDDIPCGAWHGDWRRTNMSVGVNGVAVWDWERYLVGVPLGFDALHLSLTSRSADGSAPHTLPGPLFDRATRLLPPFGISSGQVPTVVSAYLCEFATRSLEDRQDLAGTPLGDVGSWLLPELEARSAAAQ